LSPYPPVVTLPRTSGEAVDLPSELPAGENMSWVVEVAIGVLQATGYQDLADWLKDAPKKLGEEIVRILGLGIESNGTMSDDAIRKLRDLVARNPATAPPGPADLLGAYLIDLKSLVDLAMPRAVIAIKGFFHRPDCLIVLRIGKQRSLTIDDLGGDRDIVFGASGVRILVLETVTDEELRQINYEIERDSDAWLQDVEKRCEQEVVKITKNDVILQHRTTKHSTKLPQEVKCSIDGPEGIAEAFRTLPIAKEAQDERLAKWLRSQEHRRPDS